MLQQVFGSRSFSFFSSVRGYHVDRVFVKVLDPRSDDGEMLGEPAGWIRALIDVESGQSVILAALQVVGHAERLVLPCPCCSLPMGLRIHSV